MNKTRFHNYGLWISVFALIGMILIDRGVIAELGRYEMYVEIALAILTGLGIVSDPNTNNSGYLDDKID